MRDAVVSNEKMVSGERTLDIENGILRGWMHDPYDSSLELILP
jgi:hypothetical protein